jgi:hypothetical protein
MEVLTNQECRYICGLQTHNKLFEHGFPFWHDYMDWIHLFHTQIMNEYIGVEHVIIYFESCETILILSLRFRNNLSGRVLTTKQHLLLRIPLFQI